MHIRPSHAALSARTTYPTMSLKGMVTVIGRAS
ncbi:hypothetical protein EES45_33915 [Streptomyces sp. ADI97-07]|nr:hypothetical protein EES45_33915 [Streptomyces sp. ADI97-07]